MRLQLLLDWLAANLMDVLRLLECKLGDSQFPLQEAGEAGHQP